MVQIQTTTIWDDFRVVLVLAREGSVRSAARSLSVSHSTVLRRLGVLEATMGARLFERSADGYELTAAGQDVFDTASEVADVIGALERRVEGRDARLAGPVRITLPDPLLRPLLPMIANVAAAYPDIALTLASTTSFVDLAHRQADIALRIADEPPPELVGRRLAKVATGVYGATSYLARCKKKDLESLDWVGLPADSGMAFARWMTQHVPKARVSLRIGEPWALRHAVEAGIGVTILPCVTGDSEPSWTRVALVPEIVAPLWILTHRDLRTTARVRVLRDALADAIVQRRSLFEGTRAVDGGKRTARPAKATKRSPAK
jgi:DNA-binding transcriptional LysR family regulator